MCRIDELITEIYANEVLEIPGKLTEEQKESIEKRVLSNAGHTITTGSFPKRRKYILLLAAMLILTLGLTAFAAGQNEWDIALINFMGLNEAETLQLEGGKVVINKTATSRWRDYARNPAGEEKIFSITEITSIGDRNSAYLRVSTDYELPEAFDEATDYILPEHSSINITYKNIFGHESIRGFGSTFLSFYEDGKLGFLISIENCENLNKCNVSLKIENLYWHHDLHEYSEEEYSEPKEVLCEGMWEVDWTYSYKSNVQTHHTLKRVESEDGSLILTKIEVSPISVRIEAIRNPKDRRKEWIGNMLEEIHYNDGKCIQVDTVSSGSIGNGIFIDEFVKVEEFGEVFDPDGIDYLVICGQNVDI